MKWNVHFVGSISIPKMKMTTITHLLGIIMAKKKFKPKRGHLRENPQWRQRVVKDKKKEAKKRGPDYEKA